jgi:pentatricopeptide repeat protein
MKEDGAKPNHWTYSAAISACGHSRRLDEAVRLWDEMKESGLKPTQVWTYIHTHTHTHTTHILIQRK